METDGDLDIHLALGSEAASAAEVVAAALGAVARAGGGQPGSELTATSRAPGVEIGVVESFVDGPALTVELPRFTVQAGHDLIGRPELGLVTVTDTTRGHFPGLLSAADTVPFAVWAACGHPDDFEETFWTTVAGLGDRDTTCAMACGIVAARIGTAGIPDYWMTLVEPLRKVQF